MKSFLLSILLLLFLSRAGNVLVAASPEGATRAPRNQQDAGGGADGRNLQGWFKGQRGYSPNGTPLELLNPRCPGEPNARLPQNPNILMFEVHKIKIGPNGSSSICEVQVVGGTTLLARQADGFVCGPCPTGMTPMWPEAPPVDPAISHQATPITTTTTPVSPINSGNNVGRNTIPMTPMTTNNNDGDSGGCNLCSYGYMVPASIANKSIQGSRVTCGALEENLPKWIAGGQIDRTTCSLFQENFRPRCCKETPPPPTTTTSTTPVSPTNNGNNVGSTTNNNNVGDSGGCNLCSYGDFVPNSIANKSIQGSRVTCGALEENIPSWFANGQIDWTTCSLFQENFRPRCCEEGSPPPNSPDAMGRRAEIDEKSLVDITKVDLALTRAQSGHAAVNTSAVAGIVVLCTIIALCFISVFVVVIRWKAAAAVVRTKMHCADEEVSGKW